MTLEARKLSLVESLIAIKDENIIIWLEDFLKNAKIAAPKPTDFWNELSEAQKERIELAKKQLEAGEGIPHEAVMAEFRKKYTR